MEHFFDLRKYETEPWRFKIWNMDFIWRQYFSLNSTSKVLHLFSIASKAGESSWGQTNVTCSKIKCIVWKKKKRFQLTVTWWIIKVLKMNPLTSVMVTKHGFLRITEVAYRILCITQSNCIICFQLINYLVELFSLACLLWFWRKTEGGTCRGDRRANSRVIRCSSHTLASVVKKKIKKKKNKNKKSHTLFRKARLLALQYTVKDRLC